MEGKKNTSAFDVDGRVYQTEYAIKNVSEGGTIVGMKCSDGIVLIGHNENRDNEKTFEKISKVTDEIYCAFSGIYSDFLLLLEHTRVSAQKKASEFGSPPALWTVCVDLAENLQIFTQRTGNRPFGVSFLFCGESEDEYKLMSTDPSGTFLSWKCKAFGKNDEKINSTFLSEDIPENITMKDATIEIFKILKKISEISADDAINFEVLHFCKEFKGMLSLESVTSLIKSSN